MLSCGSWAAVLAAVIVAGAALYLRLRWYRSPWANRAIIGLAACYFAAELLRASRIGVEAAAVRGQLRMLGRLGRATQLDRPVNWLECEELAFSAWYSAQD